MKPNRLPMVDVIRFVSFVAIIVFHISYALWAPAGLEGVPAVSWWIIPFEYYARALSFSGFTILLLSFFLFGYRQQFTTKWLRLWWALFLFFIIWAVSSADFPYIWDIYPFLLVVIALAILTYKIDGRRLALIGGLITTIPFWYWEAHLNWPDWWLGPVLGNCSVSDWVGEDWPLLPWLGYPLFALGLGRMAQQNETRLKTISNQELTIWLVALIWSLPFLGGYFSTPLGNRFACFVFRRPPDVFWAHQLWVIFLVRLSFHSTVAARLQNNAVVSWISRRPLNQKFIVAYFVHYPFCLAWAALAAALNLSLRPWIFTLGIGLCLVWVECIPRIIDSTARSERFRSLRL